ncbi:MAG: hypothetical protein ACH37Z_15150, partial [Anaerolineae bacterium]
VPSNPDAMIASAKSARMAELKQLEEQMNNEKTPAAPEKAVEAAAELKAGPDVEAIVKAAVQPLVDQVAALTEQVAKLAAPPAEESSVIEEARKTLQGMDDAQLDAFFRGVTEQERADALALIQ